MLRFIRSLHPIKGFGIVQTVAHLIKLHESASKLSNKKNKENIAPRSGKKITLDLATPGKKCRITELVGDAPDRNKLNAMGFTPGTELYLMAEPNGLCVLKLRGSTLMLSIELARSILCWEED